MKVKVSNRSVYYKYAEIEVEVPKNISIEKVDDWLLDNEHLWCDRLDNKLSNSHYEFGFGLDGSMNEKDSESETRYDVINENYGGHI